MVDVHGELPVGLTWKQPVKGFRWQAVQQAEGRLGAVAAADDRFVRNDSRHYRKGLSGQLHLRAGRQAAELRCVGAAGQHISALRKLLSVEAAVDQGIRLGEICPKGAVRAQYKRRVLPRVLKGLQSPAPFRLEVHQLPARHAALRVDAVIKVQQELPQLR